MAIRQMWGEPGSSWCRYQPQSRAGSRVLTLKHVVGGLLMARKSRCSKMFRIASTPDFRAFLKSWDSERKCPFNFSWYYDTTRYYTGCLTSAVPHPGTGQVSCPGNGGSGRMLSRCWERCDFWVYHPQVNQIRSPWKEGEGDLKKNHPNGQMEISGTHKHEPQKKPWLWTTHLYRDYDKPLQGSLFNNQWSLLFFLRESFGTQSDAILWIFFGNVDLFWLQWHETPARVVRNHIFSTKILFSEWKPCGEMSFRYFFCWDSFYFLKSGILQNLRESWQKSIEYPIVFRPKTSSECWLHSFWEHPRIQNLN